ncbi:hypothetical protein [Amycolatopsis sp. lyj-108]|uniref:hypothetical protein n=1 Tax=Amycolatopsis sp. lyj-108 TaxID=2789286 RepID=UPI003977F96A
MAAGTTRRVFRSADHGPVRERIVTELATTKAPSANTATAAESYSDLRKDNARLRRANQEHTEHLELAIATIQRLSIDNEHLRAALDNARNITHLGPRPAQTPRH